VHLGSASILTRFFLLALLAGLTGGIIATPARSEALLLVDTDSGRVLHAENAGYPWYPASVTKIMTTYVTLRAVREGRLTLDTLLTVSENALSQQPSKMGFPVGTQVTVDNALKMLMVKSANDIAVVLAEGVSGSVEAFAGEMNRASQRLGMTQSSWVNPNGLPADGQITSARDMAILARALMREFPQHDIYWRAPAIKFGRRVMRNYNKLIGRYPGADGMKTGFICASGYNLVATASRGGRRMIAVVLGSHSGKERAETAARLLEKGFGGNMLGWLMPSLGTVEAVQPIAAAPPNMREEICGKGRGRHRTDHAEEENTPAGAVGNGLTAFANVLPGAPAGQESLIGPLVETMAPIKVTVIPPKGSVADLEASMNAPRKGRKKVTIRGKKDKGKGRETAIIAVEKPEKAGEKPAAKPKAAAKPAAAKPAAKPAPAKEKVKTKPRQAAPAPKGKSAAAAKR
jgi:D-alanyl-D-alanine carboxypeptidase